MADFRSQWSGCVEDLAGKTKALSKRFGFAETCFFQDLNGSQCFAGVFRQYDPLASAGFR
ncbi:MAG: hypothetical protein P8M80_11440 [Pirellulaceae bacterium]|nr:hypothetical protein [Pirellulaceae bacterium]